MTFLKASRLSLALILSAGIAHAHEADAHDIAAETGNQAVGAYDIEHARISKLNQTIEFHMHVTGKVGSETPEATGKFTGSKVASYVWPTNLNSAAVGFEADQGILALAVTNHPDFDDTPLFDENQDGDLGNDGGIWHSHWVVLTKDEACGPGALKVKDIEEGQSPKMPATWPGVPLFLDSPGYTPILDDSGITVQVPLSTIKADADFRFDAVTAGLKVNDSIHAPLLCVEQVWDIASGDLSLPGQLKTE